MFSKTFVFLLSCVFVAEAKIQWPFIAGAFNLTIGTPSITFNNVWMIRWGPGDPANTNLSILTSYVEPDGIYDPSKSSTFHKVQDYSGGQLGTETFVLNGATFNNIPFDANNYQGGTVGIGHSTGPNHESFVGAIVKTMEEPIAVLTYDTLETPNTDLVGAMTLGGKPDDCSSDWTRFPEYSNPKNLDVQEQFGVKLDKITAGKFAALEPGQLNFFYHEKDFFFLPHDTIQQIASGVGAQSDNSIDCNTKTKIVFTIGALNIEIGPEIYMHQFSDSDCRFWVSESPNEGSYYFPVDVLLDRCLLLDYSTFEVALAERLR